MPEIKLRPIVFKVVPPPYELISEFAAKQFNEQWGGPISYDGETQESYATDRNFICMKYSLVTDTLPMFGPCGVGFGQYTSQTKQANFVSGWLGTNTVGTATANSVGTLALCGVDYGNNNLVAGSNGNIVYNYLEDYSINDYYIETSPVETASQYSTIVCKTIIDKVNNRILSYIGNKHICTYTPNSSLNLATCLKSTACRGKGEASLQIYGCDSLEAAIQC